MSETIAHRPVYKCHMLKNLIQIGLKASSSYGKSAIAQSDHHFKAGTSASLLHRLTGLPALGCFES